MKPILRGRDIQRYRTKWAGLWLIVTFPSLHLNIEDYPAVKRHLLSYGKEKLEQTGTLLSNGTKSRKKTPHAWFELQDTCAYHAEFAKEKVVYPNMTKYRPFLYDTDGYLTNQKCFIITGNNLKYLVALLNSWLFEFAFKDKFPELLGGTRELSKIFFVNLSIPPVTPKNQQLVEQIEVLVDQIFTIKKDNPSADTVVLEGQIDQTIHQLYGLTTEQIKIIEGE